jgi:predicted small lipoprotein YifL
MKKLILLILITVELGALLFTSCGRMGPVPPPDKTPPSVLSTNPADGDRNVALNHVITINFSKEMDASTVNPQTVTLTSEEALSREQSRARALLPYSNHHNYWTKQRHIRLRSRPASRTASGSP